jgi:hypothetical protein
MTEIHYIHEEQEINTWEKSQTLVSLLKVLNGFG